MSGYAVYKFWEVDELNTNEKWENTMLSQLVRVSDERYKKSKCKSCSYKKHCPHDGEAPQWLTLTLVCAAPSSGKNWAPRYGKTPYLGALFVHILNFTYFYAILFASVRAVRSDFVWFAATRTVSCSRAWMHLFAAHTPRYTRHTPTPSHPY